MGERALLQKRPLRERRCFLQKAPPLSCCRFRITHRKSRFARVLRRRQCLPKASLQCGAQPRTGHILSARCIPHSGRSRTSPLFCPFGQKIHPLLRTKLQKRTAHIAGSRTINWGLSGCSNEGNLSLRQKSKIFATSLVRGRHTQPKPCDRIRNEYNVHHVADDACWVARLFYVPFCLQRYA